MPDNGDIVEVGEDGSVHHIESSGITAGLNMIPFHHILRTTGKPSKAGMMWALGNRNLEFRREEASQAGYDIQPCTGTDCPHCKTLRESDNG